MSDKNNKLELVRVLTIVPTAFCFGLQKITLDLFGALTDKIEAHFIVTKWNDGEFIKELRKLKIPFSLSWLGMFSRKLDLINLRMTINCLIKLPRLYIDVIRVYYKFKPDLIYFANHHELILLLPLLWMTKKKILCHMHDPPPAIIFQRINFWLYSRNVHQFIAISENVKERIIDLGGKKDKIKVIHNGVKIPVNLSKSRSIEFEKQFGWPSNSFIIGITGQMTPTKGHEDLIKAFQILSEKHNNARLVIGGKLRDPYYLSLLELIQRLDLNNKIEFSGWQEDVNDFFKQIDLFALASRHDEGYGLVVAEAMANQKPVVTTASGGVVEIVNDGITGFIVPKWNIPILAEKISQILDDKVIYEAMSIQGRLRILENFNFEKNVREFLFFLNNYK